jgi:two-component system sensor histidine kinase MprB
MSFRLRLTVLVALAVAVAVVGTSFVVYYTDRSELLGQIDADLNSTLKSRVSPDRLCPGQARIATAPARSTKVAQRRTNAKKQFGASASVVCVSNRLLILPGSLRGVMVSVRLLKRAVPNATKTPHFATVGSERKLTLDLPDRTTRISASLSDMNHNLAHLRWLLTFISLGGIGIAALLGALVSGRAIAPLRRLTETTERIVETGDLSERTGQSGRDEISRLSRRLDELLAHLDASLSAQRQLVADASHELRTPIATLRANVELLADPEKLDANERAELVADVRDELESMTTLVGELVELARGEEPDIAPSEFRLDEVVQTVVNRMARRAPKLSFRTQLEPSVVTGVQERIERAVSNLLDNARKWSPEGETIDVAAKDGVVEVRDRGPGIAEEDLSLVFNRFYRSVSARGMPGAGLGLAIVKQIVDAHGGSVTAERAPGGGTILRLELSLTR